MELFSSYVPTGEEEEEGRGQQTPRKKFASFDSEKGAISPGKRGRKINAKKKCTDCLCFLAMGEGGPLT